MCPKLGGGRTGGRNQQGGARRGGGPQQGPVPQKGPTLINTSVLLSLLEGYPDRKAAEFLAAGFTDVVRVPAPPPPGLSFADNLYSVRGLEGVVWKKIAKEVTAGRVAGPFPYISIPNLRVSPLGMVPKKTEGQYRLTHHLSYPEGSSVNSQIPQELSSVRYTTLDQAIAVVRRCGHGALMAKADIESAFRLLLIHLADFWVSV